MWHVMYAMKTQQEDLSPDILASKLLMMDKKYPPTFRDSIFLKFYKFSRAYNQLISIWRWDKKLFCSL